MDSRPDELEHHAPLSLAVGVWVMVLMTLYFALACLISAAYGIVPGGGTTTILGLAEAGSPNPWAIAGSLAFGLFLLGTVGFMVYACTELPIVSAVARERARPPELAPPPVVSRPGAASNGGSATGEELLGIDGDARLAGFTSEGALVTFGAGGVRIWDVAHGRELRHLPEACGDGALSPDGQHVALARGAFGIVLRSLDGGAERTIVHRSNFWDSGVGGVSGIAFSLDGTRLATAGDPDTRVWRVADGNELLRIPTGPTEFDRLLVAFSHDGRELATLKDGVVDIWDSGDGRRVHCLGHAPGGSTVAIAFSPDSPLLARCAPTTPR